MLFEETLAGHAIELIWRIYFFTRKGIDHNLKEVDLTYPQFGTLVALGKKENISQKKLAEALGTDTTNVMVVCDSLEKKELIERTSDPKDRRVNLIVRTEKGKRLTSDAMKHMEDYVERITGRLEEKELGAVLPTLKKLYANLIGN
jgi:DNA-binding MarR family transcriptional regulator